MYKKDFSKHVIQAKLGNEESIKYLITNYEPQIQNIIKCFSNKLDLGILDEDDIRQDCYVGLLKCLEKQNTSFMHNVFWYMVHEVERDYESHRLIIRLPHHLYEKQKELIKELEIECVQLNNETSIVDTDSILTLLNQIHFEQTLNQCKLNLSEKEFNILYLYYIEELTLNEIGQIYNVTREYIRIIKLRAIRKCKQFYTNELFS